MFGVLPLVFEVVRFEWFGFLGCLVCPKVLNEGVLGCVCVCVCERGMKKGKEKKQTKQTDKQTTATAAAATTTNTKHANAHWPLRGLLSYHV